MSVPPSPASSVAAWPTPKVAVYNVGVCAENFRTRGNISDASSWHKLQRELQFLYRRTGLVFIQEAGPVATKTPTPTLLATCSAVKGAQKPAQTRLAPRRAELHNAVVMWDPEAWAIDADKIEAAKTWGADGEVIPQPERHRKAWRWHHLVPATFLGSSVAPRFIFALWHCVAGSHIHEREDHSLPNSAAGKATFKRQGLQKTIRSCVRASRSTAAGVGPAQTRPIPVVLGDTNIKTCAEFERALEEANQAQGFFFVGQRDTFIWSECAGAHRLERV